MRFWNLRMLRFFLSLSYDMFAVIVKRISYSVWIKKIWTTTYKTQYGTKVSIWLNIYVFFCRRKLMSFSIPCYDNSIPWILCHPNHPFFSNKHFIILSGIHSYETCRRLLVQKIPKWGSYRLILRSKQQSFAIFLSWWWGAISLSHEDNKIYYGFDCVYLALDHIHFYFDIIKSHKTIR